jgi:signal transduction histidine kinase
MTSLGAIGLINAISSLTLAVFVWWKCPIPRIGRSYAAVNLAIGIFSLCYFMWQRSIAPDAAIFWMRMLTVWGMWINQLFLVFVWCLLGFPRALTIALVIVGIIRIVFSYLNFSGGLYLSVEPRAGLGFWPNIEPPFRLYMIFWHAELLFIFGSLVSAFRRSVGHRREQLKYMIVAFFIGYFGGASNWPMWFGVHIPPHFTILITAYVSIMAYAIVRHRMMEISVVVRRTLIYTTATVCLTATYLLIALLLANLLEGWVGEAGAISSTAAAVTIALLFHPLRLRIEHWINRRFPRESLDRELLREAAGGFVHEIKRPLANISMPAQLALEELRDLKEGKITVGEGVEKVGARLDFIVRESMEAGNRMEALRELLSAGQPSHGPIDLKGVIEKSIASESRRAERVGVQLTAGIDGSVIIPGNAKQLEIAFTNLLKNGIEAAADRPEPRSVALNARLVDREVIVDVQDSGPGIPSESLSRIFEPTFTTKGDAGMGIGLSLVREIVRLHRGRVEAISVPDSQTRFRIVLPAI